MFPAKPRGTAAPTDSASTRVHTTVDIRSPMEQRSPQSCAQRWTSSAQHSDLHRWHGKHAPVRGDVRLRGKWTTRASTPRAPTGDDTRSAHGRSAKIVMPVTLERGALPLKGPSACWCSLRANAEFDRRGGRDEHALVGQERSALVIGTTAWRTFHAGARQRSSERVRNGPRTPRLTPRPGAPGPCSP